MTRIFPLGDDAVPILVPDGWDVWTLDGERFERRDGVVYQWQNGWIEVETEPEYGDVT